MSLESPVSLPTLPLARGHDHDHDHAHGHGGGAGHGATAHHEARARDGAMSRRRFSPFLASAVDRIAIAAVLSGLVWIGVLWAIN